MRAQGDRGADRRGAADPAAFAPLRAAARRTAIEQYDLRPFACPRSFGYCAWRPRSWRRAPEIQARVGPNPDGGPRSPASAIAARGPQWSKSKCNRERLLVAGSCLPMRPQFAVEYRSNLPVRHGLRKRPGPISFTSPISRRCPEMRSAAKTEPVAAYAIGLATVQLSKLIATKPAFRTAARGHLRAGTPSPDRTPEGPVHSETCLTAYTGMSANAAVRPCPCISPPSVGLRTLRSSVRRIAASSGNKFALSAMFRTSFSRLGRSCLRS